MGEKGRSAVLRGRSCDPSQNSMSRSIQLVMILSAPLALAIALAVVGPRFFVSPRDLDYVVRFDMPAAGTPVDLPRVDGPADSSRPLVVIDAGHGGFDPGAGQGEVKEKAVALRIALMLRNRLVEGGGVRVALTRDTDRFISLPDRPDMARRLGADLFVSSMRIARTAIRRAARASMYCRKKGRARRPSVLPRGRTRPDE